MKKFLSQILFAILLVVCFFLTSSEVVQAVNIKEYMFAGTQTQGNNISSGELFKTVDQGNGEYVIQKSIDDAYYEKFKVQNGTIYHVEDTTWATEAGDVECSNGDEATLTYDGGQTGWIKENMNVGDKFSSKISVRGKSEVTGDTCRTPFDSNNIDRTMELAYQGCVSFPNGTTSDDAIILKISEGPGSGEEFFYDKEAGWIGFHRGGEETGAYAENQLSDETHAPGECRQITVSAAPKCLPGYSCPRTFNPSIKGEKITVVKKMTKADALNPQSAIKGITGPKANEFKFPNLDKEYEYFSSPLFKDRAFIESVRSKIDISSDALFGKIGHPGCGEILVDGESSGVKVETDQQAADITTPESYNLLLGETYFWNEAVFTAGRGTKLKVRSNQPNYPAPLTSSGDCEDNGGVAYEASSQPSTPKDLTIFQGLTGFFTGMLSNLCSFDFILNLEQCRQVDVTITLQQEKDIPGEEEFYKNTSGPKGFLNTVKVSDFAYDKPGSQRDQKEESPYYTLTKSQETSNIGTPFKGVYAMQLDTLNFIKAMYVEDIAKNITALDIAPQSIPVSTTTDNTVPYQIPFDPNITISEVNKQRVIRMVKNAWPNSKIDTLWDKVYNGSVAAGINPALTIAVWIEESGASHYNNHFSCDPKESNFDANFQCYLNTTNNTKSSFANWAKNYCGEPKDGQPICGINKAEHDNSNFFPVLKEKYNWLIPGAIQ